MGSLTSVLPLILLLMLFASSLHGQSVREKPKPTKAAKQVPGMAQVYVDSLQAVLQATPDKADKIELYGLLFFTYASTVGNLEVARQYADTIKRVATQVNTKDALAYVNYYLGMLARFDGKYTEALNYLNPIIEYCNTTGNSSLLADCLFQTAVIENELGNYDKSLEISYGAFELFEKERIHFGVARVAMNVGNLFTSMKKWEDAISMYNKSLASFTSMKQDINSKMGELRVMINMGNAYAQMKQYEKARTHYKQALLLSDSIGSTRTAATILSNMGEVLSAEGKYDSALQYHLQALRIREQASQMDKIALNLLWVGDTYMLLKNYAQAQHYLQKALSVSKEFHAKPALRDSYKKLSALYAAQQNFQKAFEYQGLFTAMKDSILNEETTRQLSELQTKYEIGEKDKQLALFAKEKQVQQKEVQRKVLQQKALIGGLLLVTVIAGLVIYLLRQRMRNQKLLMAKDQEIKETQLLHQMSALEMKALRAQMNPHFIFNCMNSINRMILEQDTAGASRYLTKLSKLIRLILENSENTSVSLQNELIMLEAYLQLENLRFKGRIGYKISVDEAIDQENTFLPSMVLQPFVENAIWHGLMHKEKEEQGFIHISIKETEDVLRCVIEDNGVGREIATALKKNSVVHSKSMGLHITEERLRLYNKGKTGQLIQITDLKDSMNRALGTRVDLLVPLE
ncbi:tetratricopeptide repeat protein [Rhodocytophaga rosea]|uniref:Tetratricopeptide repeat protein n=1 Tax=Rhodocytophaga rosea TaxID=2704465 RepID=A0A6C0GLB1_9BACT|nr:tetratricopeptide repeat protein [Rhodocytophaga rosea]QHT68798.1 tetratricopeptide repeat protein [Rhodocytophaga rosea]